MTLGFQLEALSALVASFLTRLGSLCWVLTVGLLFCMIRACHVPDPSALAVLCLMPLAGLCLARTASPLCSAIRACRMVAPLVLAV